MFANRGDHLFVVVNAARKAQDIAHMPRHLAAVAEVVPVTDRALLALQGPLAEAALARHLPGGGDAVHGFGILTFGEIWVSRSGYTGEDGFEISVPAGAGRSLCPRAAGDAGGAAHRPWRARQPAAGGGAVPLRP
jgi:aminomethyltransferase